MRVAVFERLMRNNYIIRLENGQDIFLKFNKRQFAHLIGLHYLTDIPQVMIRTNNDALNTEK